MSTLPNESTANWPNHARQSLLSDSQSVLDDQLGSPRSTVQGMGTKGVIVLETPYIDQEVPRDAWGKFMYYFKFFWTFFHGFAAGFGGLVFISLVVGDTSMTAGTRAWWWFLCCAGGCYTVYENLIVPHHKHSRTYQAFGLMGVPVAVMAMIDRWDGIDNVDHFLTQPRYVAVFAATCVTFPFFMLGEPLTMREERHLQKSVTASRWRHFVRGLRHLMNDPFLPLMGNAGTVWVMFNVPDVMCGIYWIANEDGTSNHDPVLAAILTSFGVAVLNVVLSHYRRSYNSVQQVMLTETV
eukprot:TRINITY_DN1805_c0_g1_i2.p1 TRINITY_DN1805_c0_g1~~TRINITY_DN1805_c0_g1_i2.p1  ORF type:complete len:296 (+),score=40.09 TRINITY_DN1805_c0_g1_i2:49-936(+)